MKITIEKIAELAGVSRGTVDRVIHERDGVKDEVRQKINALLIETGYQKYKSQNENRKSYKRIAVIMPKNIDAHFANMQKGMNHELKQHKELSLDYYYCDELHIDMMLSILSYISDQKVDAIAIRGFNHPQLSSYLNKLSEEGIPIVLFDSDIKGVSALCKIGENPKKSGRIAASLLARTLNFNGNVAIIAGFQEVDVQSLRHLGFSEKLKTTFPDVNIISTIYTFDQESIAYEKTRQLLEYHPEIDGLFCLAGNLSSIMKAIVDSQRKNKIKVVCYNASTDIVSYLKNGTVTFVLDINPYQQGEQVIRILHKYLIYNKKPTKPFIQLPIIIGIDENFEDFY